MSAVYGVFIEDHESYQPQLLGPFTDEDSAVIHIQSEGIVGADLVPLNLVIGQSEPKPGDYFLVINNESSQLQAYGPFNTGSASEAYGQKINKDNQQWTLVLGQLSLAVA